MKKTILLAATAAFAVMLAAAAQAATITATDRCKLLQRDFDQILMLWPTATNADSAKQARAEGADLCMRGRPADGVAKLESAFQTIGIEPRN